MSDSTNAHGAFSNTKTFRAGGLTALLFAIFIFVGTAQSANAAAYTVTTNADSGAGSLRQAVLDASATADADVIVFNIPAASCPAGVCTITLASEISIANNGSLTINGTGAKSLIIDGGAGTNRIFYSNLATFTLSGVTLTGGNGTGAGITLNGGAIFVNEGTTTISGVYFNANSAGQNGGGIYFFTGANHRIENSTFSGNAASTGGGIVVSNANLTVVNTTLSGNTASNIGGGIIATQNGTLTLRGATITVNTANVGGGVYRDTGTLDFGNTIIAGNTGTSSFPEIRFASGTATSQGFNLVGDSAGDSTATQTAITYQSTDILDTPPLLDPLADYGGTTPTRRLQTGSPAIDKGNSFGSTTDQRGFTRPVDNLSITNATGGDGADIGAFEVQPAAPTAATVTISGRATTSTGRGIRNVMIRLTDGEGHTRSAITTAFGYYRFTDVNAGETVVITAKGRRYEFSQPTLVLNVGEDVSGVNFVAY